MTTELALTDAFIRDHEDEIRIGLKLWLNDTMLCPKCKLFVLFKKGNVNTNYFNCPFHSEYHAKSLMYAMMGHDIVQEFIDDYICWVYKQGVS